jgi:hypothetical protein
VADSPQAQTLPQAGTRRTRWATLIWALPVAALLIVVYLAIQWIAERGEIVMVTFARSAGARVGETCSASRWADLVRTGGLKFLSAIRQGARMQRADVMQQLNDLSLLAFAGAASSQTTAR